jgi:hypothetical protein
LSEWGNTPSIEYLINNINNDQINLNNDPNIDEYSKQYWEKAANEARKLEFEMTPEQIFYLK